MVKFIIVERTICDAISSTKAGAGAVPATMPTQGGYALGQSFGKRRRW